MKSWLACGAYSIVTFVSLNAVNAQTAGESHVAFSVIRVEKVTNAATGANWETRTLEAVNSSGDRVSAKSTTQPSTGAWDKREVLLSAERKRVIVSEALRAITTFYLPERGPVRRPRADCAPDSAVPYIHLGRDSLLGYQVFKYSRSEKMRSGEFVTFEYWYAPQLDCLTIKASAEFRREDGTLDGRSEKTAVAIQFGEPDPALFKIPAEYREMKPSEVEKMSLDRAGYPQPLPESLKRTWEAHDQKYAESQRLKR